MPTDGMIHKGERLLCNDSGAIRELPGKTVSTFPAERYGIEHRLLDPRPEPTEEEKRRKDYRDLGLADWEIELLMESER